MGIYYSRKFDNGAELAVWEVTETEEELLARCGLSDEEREELDLTKNPQRRKERLAVRALLHHLFPKERVYLGYYDNGRPYLQNSIVEISISHTERFTCIFTHPELSLGVDIESLHRNFSAVERRVLHPEEVDFLSDKAPVRKLQLAILWSAKEALYKYMSRSEVDFSEQIRIEHFTPRDSGKLDAVFYEKDGEKIVFDLEYMILDDHIMVWVIE